MTACLNTDSVRTFSRSYAKAVAGKTQAFSFNATTRALTLQYLIVRALRRLQLGLDDTVLMCFFIASVAELLVT